MAEDPNATVVPGTTQLRPGEIPADSIPPVMPTVRGDASADSIAPAMPTMRGDAAPTGSAPPAMPPARYVLGPEIARGGMGRVVEATDTTLGRVVALKEALALDSDTLRRFERETRITARLEHPSIVPVHDAGIGPNGSPYYVMRKIGGRPLEKFVAEGETIAARLALVPAMVAASHAIAHAHERGIVHRDIKPSNILVGDLGETIVIDWGLAKVIGEAEDDAGGPVLVDPDDSLKTRAGIVYGTPGFMAPEQLRGRPVDARCDVYALGATLYHLLSRKPPHFAATAEAMMKAAVNSPPTPIGELVAGVPPELSTIIDKALTHDPDDRYQNARELAEDLNRFVTGQLVASHHYTTREKLERFVRKHKVPVLAVTAALLALLVGGVVAYVRVSHARDRADAAAVEALDEKNLAQLQNEKLTLSQAWIVADSNPTLAVAMVKPLAEKHWREVRAIAAAARTRGVAWSLPASPGMTSLEMSRDGTLALGAGDDGVVRIYDLGKRTAQTIAETGGMVRARLADQERKVVLWNETKLTVIDRAGGGRRDLSVPTPIHYLELVGITAYWTDTSGGLWQLDLAGTQPLQLALDQRVTELAPSPDGRWIALTGEHDLLLMDRTQPTAAPQVVAVSKAISVDWASDGSHLAALVDDSAYDVQMSPVPTIFHRLTVGTRFFVAYGNNAVYTIGPTGVAVVSRESSRPRRQLGGAPVGLAEARGNTMIAGSETGIAVISDAGDHLLSIPTGRLSMIAASSRSPYVIGAIDDRLLVWNLDEIQPAQVADRPATATLVGSTAVIATFLDAPAKWIDLVTGASHALPAWPAITSSADAPGGGLAVVVDLAHHAKLVTPDKAPVELEGVADMVGFPSAHELLLGSYTGTLQLHDTITGKRTTLVAGKTELIGLSWSRSLPSQPAWVAAVFKDQTLWRQRIGGEASTTKLPAKPNSALHVRDDGTVLFAVGSELMAWDPDGTVRRHAQLRQPIVALGTTGTDTLVAFSDAGAAYLVDSILADTVTDIGESLGRTKAAMSADSGLIVVEDRGSLTIIDPLTDHKHWVLASLPGITLTTPQISSDGRRVAAQTATSLLVWTLALPQGPEETTAWLDRMSNASTGSGPKSLGWR
ncbi:hypothetical protein BH11MYX3_BH11MYX3_25000 [soil metagenome]